MVVNDLKGKVALVTGAGRGIGRAVALALAQAGADVAVNYRSSESEARVVSSQIQGLGCRSVAVRADVSQATEVFSLVDAVQKELGPVAILVNNAGVARLQPVEEVTERDWDEVLSVNLKSMFLLIQALLPVMRANRWGRIINLSSVAAQVGGIVGPHYAASKAGVQGLTHYYASLLAGEGVTVNAIAPGPIGTEMVAKIPQLRPDLVPVGRFGTVGEVADVAVMLARNGYITGQTMNVNGGRYMS